MYEINTFENKGRAAADHFSGQNHSDTNYQSAPKQLKATVIPQINPVYHHGTGIALPSPNIKESSYIAPAQRKENKSDMPDKVNSGIEISPDTSIGIVRKPFHNSHPAQFNACTFAPNGQIDLSPAHNKNSTSEAGNGAQQMQNLTIPSVQMKKNVMQTDEEDKSGILEENPAIQGTIQGNSIHTLANHPFIIQRKPANVHGLTHLVKKAGNSIMNGEEKDEVTEQDQLDVDPNKRLRSRRGPNQEMVGDYDKRGEHIYRWFLVNEINHKDVAGEDLFIREDTFSFSNERDNPIINRDLSQMPDRRTRQSHYAIRLEVWCNTDRKIDNSGHLVMADKSLEYQNEDPYLAYEMGKDLKPQDRQREADFIFDSDDRGAVLTKEQEKFTKVEVDDARDRSKKIPGLFKTLDQKRESGEGIRARLKNQKRYVSDKTGEGYLQPQEGRTERPRFNKHRWVELLVTKEEYNYLIQMWQARSAQGFYCFIREARTVQGFDLATRCLSFLEDIAMHRNQKKLAGGHAEDILSSFKEINQITDKHSHSE
ncbi:MAG: hypothetical protein MUC87_15070 [Bacteroidia bacterium]|jgi:hypothetical protein|nr:hypothetical protein [Bacteroidia bacterium]